MNRIKQLRKHKNLSQNELAKILNVHQTAISQWETGKTHPDMAQAIQMANYFSVSVDYILGRNEEPHPESTKSDAGIWHIAKDRDNIIQQYPPEAIEEIEKFFDYIEYKYLRDTKGK